MCLSDLSGCNLVALSSSIAIAISKPLSADETNLLAAFITAVGDNLAIIAAQKTKEEEQKNSSSNNIT